MCDQCRCEHCPVQPAQSPPFRFTDIPVRQWVVGTFMTLAVAVAILVRMA